MLNATPDDVGVTLLGFGVQVVGGAPVQLSATELLYPFTAVNVPVNVADCEGKMVCVPLEKLN